ncbi:unnamed protein product [Rhodiola kirilowii]
MGEGDSTTPIRSLEVSVSFGRFDNDLLSWEKWSSFSQNKYLEEVEKCATPGSVAQKKAFFEARNKLIAVKKGDMLNKQMETCQELDEEKEIQNMRGSEVNQYDEEPIDENLFGSEVSSMDMNEHPELDNNVFVSQEPDEKDVIEEISTNQLITGETIHMSETSSPLIVDYSNKDSTIFTAESEMLTEIDPDENTHDSNSEFYNHDGQNSDRVQDEPILNSELSGCETDQPVNLQSSVLMSAQTDGEKLDGHYIDAPEEIKEEAIFKNKLSPNSLDQLKMDNAWPGKSSSTIEVEHAKSKNTEDIPGLKTNNTDAEPNCDRVPPNISADKSAQSQKKKPNSQKLSKKIISAYKQDSSGNIKKTLVSSVPRSPQMSTPKISKSSTPTVKSASLSLPVSRVKKTATSAPVVPKSPQLPNATKSSSHVTTSSLKPSSSSPSKKGADSLTSRKKSIQAGESRKPIPTSLHTSLNFGLKVSGSVSSSTPVIEPMKSLFMEKMGDKDIVKRAFRAFQYMSTSPNFVSVDTNGTPKQVVRNKTDGRQSTPPLQKEKDRLIKKGEVYMNSKKPASIIKIDNPARHCKEDRRNKVKKGTENAEHKEAANSHYLSNNKERRETRTGDGRQSLTYKATSQPGLYKRQSLSKSFQDKDAYKSEQRL